jgi:hypothetical protein
MEATHNFFSAKHNPHASAPLPLQLAPKTFPEVEGQHNAFALASDRNAGLHESCA